MGLVQQAREHPTQGIPVQTSQAHSHSQHEKHQCNEERGHILSRIFEGFPSISASFSFACYWTRDLHWKTPYDHSFKQYFLKAPEMRFQSKRSVHRGIQKVNSRNIHASNDYTISIYLFCKCCGPSSVRAGEHTKAEVSYIIFWSNS